MSRIVGKSESIPPSLRIGLLTDVHYLDCDPDENRRYRDSLLKVREAATVFREREVDLALELGDFTDEPADVPTKIAEFRQIDAEFRASECDCRHIVGNHGLDLLTKGEYLAAVGETRTFYSFDHAGFHFVVLDGCFRSDGEPYRRGDFDWTEAIVPEHELRWLTADLSAAATPTVVFIHQRLDCDPPLGLTNARSVREILEHSGRVRAVFQGHDHEGGYSKITGIHYCTLKAVIDGEYPEGNAYAVAELFANGNIHVEGFRRQNGYRLEASR